MDEIRIESNTKYCFKKKATIDRFYPLHVGLMGSLIPANEALFKFGVTE
jgi:hypothetical protein